MSSETLRYTPEEWEKEKERLKWLDEHPFTKKWYKNCPFFDSNPFYEKQKIAETIDKEKINIEENMSEKNKIKLQCDPRDIYVVENNRNPEREVVEKRMKEKEQHILKAYAFLEDRKREENKQEMESGLLSEREEQEIRDILRINDVKKKEEYVTPECKIVEERIVPGDFDGICRNLMYLHARKNKDYGNAAHESYKEFGLISYVIRLNDKMKRLKSLTKPGAEQEVKDESIEDTLMDLAAYAIMAIESLRN